MATVIKEDSHYTRVTLVECDSCGKHTEVHYDKSSWWGKYLANNEEKICVSCAKSRDGFKEEYFNETGITL